MEDVLKALSPGRKCIGLAKRYIDLLSRHPSNFSARQATDFDRVISQRKPTAAKSLKGFVPNKPLPAGKRKRVQTMTTNRELDQIGARFYNSNHVDVMISAEETEERAW
ncbi:hypothetical protein [Corynebacterium propinquum]|uniref:hypothetical protein n=1 Tax=Corynebacterium propinquum TaxID=43769 RepID=UPI00254BE7DB|nr:hypothetical protein [Corynebacterium propinquum]MDK8534992.1 hypothetical protein [Corynebacterium propinquum]